MSGTILGNRNGATEQTATADITLAISTVGNDTVTDARRSKILNGDKSTLPFLTLQAAADSLPKHLAGKTVTINIGAATFGSATFSNLHDGVLYVKGSTTAATLTSGSVSGTAGTGTSATSFKKPTAAANWTVDDLRNRICKIVFNGTTYWRVITTNTIDTATIASISGLDNTATFQFVNVTSLIAKNSSSNCLIFDNCTCEVIIEAIKPSDTNVVYGIYANECKQVVAYGCDLSIDTVATFYAYDCESVTLTDSCMTSSANVLLERCPYSVVSRMVSVDGSIKIENALYAEVLLDAKSVAANAVKFLGCLYATASLNANTCSASPLVVDGCARFTGGNLTGANPGTARGIELLNGGTHSIVGATIAGNDSEVLIDDLTTTYANLAANGTVYNSSTFVIWGSGTAQSLRGLSIPNGTVTVGGQFQTYGHWYQLGNADVDISAFTAGGQASATQIGYQSAIVSGFTGSAVDGASIRIRDGLLAAGAGGRIINDTDNAISLYPISGGSINTLATDTSISIPARSWALWRSTGAFGVRVIILYKTIVNITGNAATVTTNANLTGPITSVGNATTIADPELAAIAGLVSAADKGIQFTGSGTAATYDLTIAGKALLDDADATAQRTTLGLGTLATQNGTFSGTSSGTNTGDQTNISGNAATVTTNANLTGIVTSVGNATAIANGAITDNKLARNLSALKIYAAQILGGF